GCPGLGDLHPRLLDHLGHQAPSVSSVVRTQDSKSSRCRSSRSRRDDPAGGPGAVLTPKPSDKRRRWRAKLSGGSAPSQRPGAFGLLAERTFHELLERVEQGGALALAQLAQDLG